jgi:hypothetical protein
MINMMVLDRAAQAQLHGPAPQQLMDNMMVLDRAVQA